LRMVMVNVWQAGGLTPLLAQTVVGPNVPAMVAPPARMPASFMVSPGGSAPLVTAKVGAGSWGLDVNWWA
jgi:hypothetical protein